MKRQKIIKIRSGKKEGNIKAMILAVALLMPIMISDSFAKETYTLIVCNQSKSIDDFSVIMKDLESSFLTYGVVKEGNTIFLDQASKTDLKNEVLQLSQRANDDDVLLVPWLTHGLGYWARYSLLFTQPIIYSSIQLPEFYDATEKSLQLAFNFIEGWQKKHGPIGLGEKKLENQTRDNQSWWYSWMDSLGVVHYQLKLSGVCFNADSSLSLGERAPIIFERYALRGDSDQDGFIPDPAHPADDFDGNHDGLINEADISSYLIERTEWGLNSDINKNNIPDHLFVLQTSQGPRVAVDFDNPQTLSYAEFEVDGLDENNDGILDWADLDSDGELKSYIAYPGAFVMSDGVLYDYEFADIFKVFPGKVVIICGACYGGEIHDDLYGRNVITYSNSSDTTLASRALFINMKFDIIWLNQQKNRETINLLDLLKRTGNHSYLNDNGDRLATPSPWSIEGGRDGYSSAQILLFNSRAVENENALTSNFIISQNYPNPFNGSTTIHYSLPEPSNVTLKIYNLAGQEIETLVNERKNPGVYEVQWQASSYPSGIYFYKFQTWKLRQIRKMTLIN